MRRVTSQGDAPQGSTSSAEPLPAKLVRGYLPQLERYARAAFALFIALHVCVYAWRATHATLFDADPGFESQRSIAIVSLSLVWVPFLLFVLREFSSFVSVPKNLDAKRLALVERSCLAVVLLFSVFHLASFSIPLLAGKLEPSDMLPELSAELSSTYAGVPLRAIVYLVALGAASFHAARTLVMAFGSTSTAAPAKPRLFWVAVAFGTGVYATGALAVIRIATGSLSPW
jgi:hypothetical protein